MANQWFRMYSEFASDPKVQMMSEADQRRFVMLLCMRCSNDDVTLHDDEIAFQLRISNEQWAATKAVFLAKKLINKDNTPTAWDKRQFVSDSSAARVAKHRANKKHECNVTVTPPEAEAEADTDNYSSLSSAHEVETTSAPTRKGLVCGMLRKAGMADAAPHYLTDDTWETILTKRTDEEIVEVAKAKMAAMPNQRIGLKYIAKALMDDPKTIDANSRASPTGRRQTLTETRSETIAALTGKNRHHERTIASERDITSESTRIE